MYSIKYNLLTYERSLLCRTLNFEVEFVIAIREDGGLVIRQFHTEGMPIILNEIEITLTLSASESHDP